MHLLRRRLGWPGQLAWFQFLTFCLHWHQRASWTLKREKYCSRMILFLSIWVFVESALLAEISDSFISVLWQRTWDFDITYQHGVTLHRSRGDVTVQGHVRRSLSSWADQDLQAFSSHYIPDASLNGEIQLAWHCSIFAVSLFIFKFADGSKL